MIDPSEVDSSIFVSPTEINDSYSTNATTQNALPDDRVLTPLSAEHLELLYGVPDEILSATTFELLDYFLQSHFMKEMVFQETVSSSIGTAQLSCDDFYFHHEAFAELISRDDLVETLELFTHQYASYSTDSTDTFSNDGLKVKALSKFLNHTTISSLVNQAIKTNSTNYPYLSQIDNAQLYAVGDLVGRWGQAAVYIHEKSSVPAEYTYDGINVDCLYYRYHDYSNVFTGCEYHAGSYHIFQYADQCSICGYQTNFTIKRLACDGPPCRITINASDDEETA